MRSKEQMPAAPQPGIAKVDPNSPIVAQKDDAVRISTGVKTMRTVLIEGPTQVTIIEQTERHVGLKVGLKVPGLSLPNLRGLLRRWLGIE